MKKKLCTIMSLLLVVAILLGGCGSKEPKEPKEPDKTVEQNKPEESDQQKEPVGQDTPEEPNQPEEPVKPEHGDVLQLKMDVGVNAVGPNTYYNRAFVLDSSFTLEPGDEFVYDVYLYNELGGVGTVDMYAGDNLEVTLRDDVLCMDQHAVRNHPTTNIAGLALNQWYTRKVPIGDAFVTEANGNDGTRGTVLIAVDIPEIKYYAGQQITVAYDNICIMRGDEVVYTVFSGREHALPGEFTYIYDLAGNENVTTTLQIVDETGVPVAQ